MDHRISCDFPELNKNPEKRPSGVYRQLGNFTWQGIKKDQDIAPTSLPDGTVAKQPVWAGVSRQILYGNGGEKGAFEVRYFEIAPGGHSAFESHAHEHSIVVLRGSGFLRFDDQRQPLTTLDMAYVGSKQRHQFINPAENKEPLGFLCIVDKSRDVGVPIAE